MHTIAQKSVIPNDAPTAVLAGKPFSFAAAYSFFTESLASGTAGTFQTLEAMKQCVLGNVPPDFCGYQHDWVRETARAIASDTNSRDRLGPIKQIFDFIRDSVKYIPHPIDQQVVQDCCRTIQFASGDCVSMSVCLATLLASLGYQVRFVAQYYDDNQLYSHVYCECQNDDYGWIALDAVAKDKPLGWSQKLPNNGFETTYEIFEGPIYGV